jgi:hypothetical protein
MTLSNEVLIISLSVSTKSKGNDDPETHELILSEPFLIWRSSLSSSPGTAI